MSLDADRLPGFQWPGTRNHIRRQFQPARRPGIAGLETLMISANVTGIDRADHRLTLTDDNGDTRNVKVAAETPIELIKVGDEVRVRLTRAVTISVEPPPASN